MAKGFGSMAAPRRSSISNVSLALWPTARKRVSQSISSRPRSDSVTTPRKAPPERRRSLSLHPKRISPPRERICRLRFPTTSARTSVPTWGMASQRMRCCAPKPANRRSTYAAAEPPTPVFSFPSEKVPAPPSPNCTLHSVSRMPFSRNRRTFSRRCSTGRPRSKTSGRRPASASARAMNMPAGPKPATSGRRSGSLPGLGRVYAVSCGAAKLRKSRSEKAVSSSTATSTV